MNWPLELQKLTNPERQVDRIYTGIVSSYRNKDSTINSHVASLKLTVSPEYSYHPYDFLLLRTKSIRRQRLKLLALPSLSLPSPQLLSMQFGSNLVHFKSVQLMSSPEQNWMEHTESPKGDKSFSHTHFIWISPQLSVLIYYLWVSNCNKLALQACRCLKVLLNFATQGPQNTKHKQVTSSRAYWHSDTGKYLSLRNESNTTYNLYYL